MTQSNKVKGAWRAQQWSRKLIEDVCWRPDPKCSDSFLFRQHLKCTLTAPRRAGTSSGFFISFYSASCLSLGDLVQRCLGQPVDLLAPWPSAAVIPRQLSTAVHFQSVERRVQRNLEGLANVHLDKLTVVRRHWLFFFFYCLRGEGEDSERGQTKFSAGVTVTAPTTMHAEERQRECSQRHSEVRAGRLSGRFRLRAYRTVQTRPVSSRSVHHWIFPDVYFYTQSLQRLHERRPMASRRKQVSALFFVAWTQRRLAECFPWATEGPNPPKETLTFKKEFFFGKQLRDHYPRALSSKTCSYRALLLGL